MAGLLTQERRSLLLDELRALYDQQQRSPQFRAAADEFIRVLATETVDVGAAGVVNASKVGRSRLTRDRRGRPKLGVDEQVQRVLEIQRFRKIPLLTAYKLAGIGPFPSYATISRRVLQKSTKPTMSILRKSTI